MSEDKRHEDNVSPDENQNGEDIFREWRGIPIRDYLASGYRPRTKIMRGRMYITLRRGDHEISLGPFSVAKWARLKDMVPKEQEVPAVLSTDQYVQSAIQGTAKGTGYLEELKNMIRDQISRTRELTQFCYNLGLGALTASLSKSGISMDEFRKIAKEEGLLKDAFTKAAETVFKALDYYQADAIKKLEEERDEARAAYSLVAAQLNELMKNLDPKIRLEKMILAYLSSGNVDPNVVVTLIDKWLSMEVVKVRQELIA